MQRRVRRWARELMLLLSLRRLLGSRRRAVALALATLCAVAFWMMGHAQSRLEQELSERSGGPTVPGLVTRGGATNAAEANADAAATTPSTLPKRASLLRLQERTAESAAVANAAVVPNAAAPVEGSSSQIDRAAAGSAVSLSNDEWEEEGQKCPPVLSASGQPLPPIPVLYEPRAPRALWMPPLPFTPDPTRPHSFNIDPLTGESNTRTVYRSEVELSPEDLSVAAGVGAKRTVTLSGWETQPSAAPSSSGQQSQPEQQHRYPSKPLFSPRSLLDPEYLVPPAPSCAQTAVRTRAYWTALDLQRRQQRPLNVLVWHGTWRHTTEGAKTGGPMGELGLFTSTMLALTALSVNLTFLTDPLHESALVKVLPYYLRYDIILMDTYSSDLMQRLGYLSRPDFLCRLRALDYWGTPSRQNSWKLPQLEQYLVPFACTLDGSSPNHVLAMHRYENYGENQTESFRWDETAKKRWAEQKLAEKKGGGHAQGALTWHQARTGWPALDSETFEGAGNTEPWPSEDSATAAAAAAATVTKDSPSASASASGASSPPPVSSAPSLFRSGLARFPRLYTKRFQVLIWGKEARYFEGLTPLLRALAEVAPLLSVVRADGLKHFPNVDDLSHGPDGHPRIRQLGILDQTTMARTMRESALILGVGDPIFSFTPLEALQVGTPYVNPLFSPPKRYWMNGDCVITSQHPYAERIGAPAVWNFDPRDLKAAQRTLRTALKWVRQTQDRHGGIPPLYPSELHFDKLVGRLNDNFRQDYCAAHGMQPTPAHRHKN